MDSFQVIPTCDDGYWLFLGFLSHLHGSKEYHRRIRVAVVDRINTLKPTGI
jgi:hypothetical protein